MKIKVTCPKFVIPIEQEEQVKSVLRGRGMMTVSQIAVQADMTAQECSAILLILYIRDEAVRVIDKRKKVNYFLKNS
jgi:hypothetical protein